MRADFLQEPELEFGQGRHVDVRFGLMHSKPLDYQSSLAPKKIALGIVGTDQSIVELRAWLETCARGLPAKHSNQPNLFPPFPGFGSDSPFQSEFIFDSRLERQISTRELPKSVSRRDFNRFVSDLVCQYIKEAEYLAERGEASVFVCALPLQALNLMEPEEVEDEEERAGFLDYDFHDLLKARAMQINGMKPIQVVLPMTYSENVRRRQRRRRQRFRMLQDSATRAWNFHTALYYKASGTPWRLVRDSSELTCCFVGVSFYKTLDGSKLLTSAAQIFNERGQGVIIRGGTANVSKDDRDVHLDGEAAYSLMAQALLAYKAEHHTMPARIVVHKTSSFNDDERDGFVRAIKESKIEFYDLIHIDRSFTRLFRDGLYPPLRGTAILVDEDNCILYTRGAVEFFQTYPGMYVPRPIEICAKDSDRAMLTIAHEVLALTKMNWNNTQFDNAMPITVQAARRVGRILKYVGSGDKVNPSYSFYM